MAENMRKGMDWRREKTIAEVREGYDSSVYRQPPTLTHRLSACPCGA